MPIPKAKVVILSEVERQGLERLLKRHQTDQQVALRARIVLAAAGRVKNKEIAEKYQLAADTVRLWRNRWVALQDIYLNDLSVEERLRDGPRPCDSAIKQVDAHYSSSRYLPQSGS
jgi:putative transposase